MADFPLIGGLPPQYVFQLFNSYMDMEQMKRASISDALKLNAQQRAMDMRDQLAQERMGMDQQNRAFSQQMQQQKYLSSLENMSSQMQNRDLQSQLSMARLMLENDRNRRENEMHPYQIDKTVAQTERAQTSDSKSTFGAEQAIEKDLFDDMGVPKKNPTPEDVMRYNEYLTQAGSGVRYKRITLPAFNKQKDWWFDTKIPERTFITQTDAQGNVNPDTLRTYMQKYDIDPEDYDMVEGGQ